MRGCKHRERSSGVPPLPPPAPPRGTPAAPLRPGSSEPLDRPDGDPPGALPVPGAGRAVPVRTPRSHLGSAEPSAEGSGQHGASRNSAAARLPAPAARRRGGSAPGTARGADRSGVRPVPAPGRPVRSSTDRFFVMGRVRVRLPWGGIGFTAGFPSRSRFLSQIPDCIPGYPPPVPLSPQPNLPGIGTPHRFPQSPEHSRSAPAGIFTVQGMGCGAGQWEGSQVAPRWDKEEPIGHEEVPGRYSGCWAQQTTPTVPKDVFAPDLALLATGCGCR